MSKDRDLPAMTEFELTPHQQRYEDADRKGMLRSRLETRIVRWKIRQRRERQWANFDDVADHLARTPGNICRDEVSRAQAQHDLIRSVVNGEFSPAGRIRVAYLPEISIYARRPRVRLVLSDLHPNRLADCWAPRELWEEWFARRPDLRLPPRMSTPSIEKPPGSPTSLCKPLPQLPLAMKPELPVVDQPPSPKKPKGTLKAVTIWFKERSDRWPDNEKAPTEKRDWDDAKDYFAPGLDGDVFREARDTTPAAWRKQGRRLPWGETKLNLP